MRRTARLSGRGGTRGSGRGGRRGGSVRRSLLGGSLASATDTRGGLLVGVDVRGEVLQSVGVHDGLGTVRLGQLEALLVGVGVVGDKRVGDGGDMEESVNEVCGEVVRGRRSSDGVAESAPLLVVLSDLVREGADDGLQGAVGTPPVTGPTWIKARRMSVLGATI